MSESHSLHRQRIDPRPLMADAQVISGHWPLPSLPRLADAVLLSEMPQDAPISWRLQGELRPVTGGEPEMWMRVGADAEVALTCQRCLAAVREHLVVDRWVRFVPTEQEAEALDAELEDDVLALPKQLDVRELIEDELILVLPLVPRHGVCPKPLPVPADELPEEPEEHPFAALAGLKGKLGG